jgi:predicted permease
MQMAISLLLLISAALFAKTLVNLSRVDLGLRPDHLVTLSLNPRLNRYTPERTAQFYEQLAERLAALPGVTLVAAARVLPVSGSSSSTNITVEGYTPAKDDDNQCRYNDIGPDYFRTLGIPLIAGREFSASDNTSGAPPTAIVNESFARHYFGGQNPVGRRFARGSGDNIQYRTIIGLVKDSKYSDVRETIPRAFYLPYRAITSLSTLNLFVRTSVAPESLMPAVRAEVAAIDPNLPLRNLRTMEAVLESRMTNERLLWRLTGIFGGLATVLAAVGLYGVLAFNIGRRTREIGIRIALGARAGHVRGLVVREVAVMLGIGTIIGIAAAGGVSQILKGTLFGVEPLDPVTYLSAAAALGIIALAAAYIPARRATSVDPLVALRYE